MSKVKIEAFLSNSNSSNKVSELLKQIQLEYKDKLYIFTYQKDNKLFKNYNLTSTPAIVIEEMIKIVGFCPSKETIISALRDVGLE